MTVQLAGNLLTSPADRAAGAAVGENQGRVIYFPSCAGKRPVHGRFTSFPGGVRRAVMRCRTVQQHTVDGVTIRYPLMGWRFTTPPPGGTSCFTTHRRRSGRRARPNFGRALPGSRPKFGQRYRCDNLSQPLPAGSVWHGAPHQAGPVAIHGHCLRLYPVRPAYRPALYVDGFQRGTGVDQRREVKKYLFIWFVVGIYTRRK